MATKYTGCRRILLDALYVVAVMYMWVLVACGAITFAFFFIMTLTKWNYVDATEFIAWRNGLVLDYKFVASITGKMQPMLSSTTNVILLWQWCATLSMALGAAGLSWLSSFKSPYTGSKIILPAANPKAAASAIDTTSPATPSNAPKRRRSARVTAMRIARRMRHLLRLQVPPHGLWRWLLGPDGLSVLDLLLVLTWFGLHILWLQQMTSKALDSRRAAPPPPQPKVTSPSANSTSALLNGTAANATALNGKLLPSPPANVAPPASSTTNQAGLRRLLQQGAAGVNKTGSGTANKTAAAPAAKTTTVKPLPQAVQSSIAQWTGLIGNLDLMLLFFPLPRCNFLHWLLGSDFPSLLKYHRWLGHATILMYSIHGIMYLGFWARDGVMAQRLVWGMNGSTNSIAGVISMAGAWLIWLTCIPVIRRRFFSVFFASHLSGVLLLLLFGFMHRKDVMPWIMPGALLYLLDVVLRTIQQNFNSTCIRTAAEPNSAISASISTNGTILTLVIHCDKSLHWMGSDIVFLNVPAVSWWQWHPFTLASSSAVPKCANGGNKMVLHIKTYSHWTQRLVARLASDPTPLKLYVSGPFQSANRKWLSGFEHHVFVAGGIGATPAFGILLQLIARRKAASTASDASIKPQAADEASSTTSGSGAAAFPPSTSPGGRATFVWLTRNEDELNTLPLDILLEASRTGEDAWLDLQIYLTASPTPKPDGPTGQLAAPPPAVVGESASLSSNLKQISSNPLYTPEVHVQMARHRGGGSTAGSHGHANAERLAHPYMFSPLLWMVAVLLCFGGAFAGLISVQAYDARIARTVAVRHDFTHVGMLQFAALGIGAVLPPALLMLAVHVYWRISHRRSGDDIIPAGSRYSCDLPISAFRHGSCAEAARLASLANARMSVTSTGTCDTDNTVWETAAATAAGCTETGLDGKAGKKCQAIVSGCAEVSSFISFGRPDLRDLLERLSSTSSSGLDPEDEHMAVLVAGPVGLVEAVEELCASLNGVWGRKGRAYMQLKPLTHEF